MTTTKCNIIDKNKYWNIICDKEVIFKTEIKGKNSQTAICTDVKRPFINKLGTGDSFGVSEIYLLLPFSVWFVHFVENLNVILSNWCLYIFFTRYKLI